LHRIQKLIYEKGVCKILQVNFLHEGEFMKLRGLYCALIATTVYSCGPTPESKDALKEIGDLPMAAIIAVRDNVDASANVAADDLRTLSAGAVQTSADKLQEQEIPALYDKAQQSETVVTQQQEILSDVGLRGWFHYRQCPGQLVRVSEMNQQEPLILDSCQAYHQYQPVYILRGRSHRFFFHRAHKLRNVTYYYYVNQASEQQVGSQSTKQAQSTAQKQKPEEQKPEEQKPEEQKPEEQKPEKQIEQQEVRKTECQKQVPTQKTVPMKTTGAC
jgi:hypothetical protein